MPNLEKKEGLSLWNVGETPGDENASAMRDGILRKYSRRKRIDEPGSPVRKGGVVHRNRDLSEKSCSSPERKPYRKPLPRRVFQEIFFGSLIPFWPE
ncbi:MAG: hypothetical protein RXR41_02255 [Candidatus Marsarchaeota archaeon]